VIASRLPALEEIIQHEKTGLLFDSGSKEDLMKALEKCIEHTEFSKTLGLNAKEWVVEHRTWKRVVENTLSAYAIAKEEARV